MLEIILYIRMHEYTFEQDVQLKSEALYISIHYCAKFEDFGKVVWTHKFL